MFLLTAIGATILVRAVLYLAFERPLDRKLEQLKQERERLLDILRCQQAYQVLSDEEKQERWRE